MPAPKSEISNNFPIASELIVQLLIAANLDVSELRGPSNNKRRAVWSRNEHVMEYIRIEAYMQLYDLLVDGTKCPWRGSAEISRVVGAMRLHDIATRYDTIVSIANGVGNSPGDFVQLWFRMQMMSVIGIVAAMMRLHGVDVKSLTFPFSKEEMTRPAKALVDELEQLNPKSFHKSEYRDLQRALAGEKMQSGFGENLKRELQKRELALPNSDRFTCFEGHYQRARFVKWISKNRLAGHWTSLHSLLLVTHAILSHSKEEELWLLCFGSPPAPTPDEIELARLFLEDPKSLLVEEALLKRRMEVETQAGHLAETHHEMAIAVYFQNREVSQFEYRYLDSIISGNPAPFILELLQTDPSEITSSKLLLVATTFSNCGWFDSAIGILSRLVEDSEYGIKARRELAGCYFEIKSFERARDTLLEIPKEQRLGTDIEKLALIERALVTGKYYGPPESVPSAKLRKKYRELGKEAARYGYNQAADDYRRLDSRQRKSPKQT